MDKIPDTSPGITSEPHHVVAGVYIGRMGLTLNANIQSVLTIGTQAGVVPDAVHHRHIPLSYSRLDIVDLDLSVEWVLDQVRSERCVLIRSESGRQRPGLVAGMVILRLGGTYYDAINCVRHAQINALTDFRYLGILKEADNVLNKRLRNIPRPR